MKEDKNPEAKNDEKKPDARIEIDRGLKDLALRSNRRFENQIFENRIDREWLTTIEAAHWLAISPNALRILVHRNQVSVYKFGRRLRFRMTDLQALFQRKGA
jgi:excisionase family DNA binding protein